MTKQTIENINISLTADSSDLKKGFDVAKQSTHDLDGAIRKLNSTASGSRKAFNDSHAGALSQLSFVRKFRRAIGLIGYTAAPIISSINTSKAVKELSEMSKVLGVSVKQLDAFGKSVESTGGDSSQFTTTVKTLTDGLDELKEKGEKSKAFSVFKELGVSAYDANGNLRNVFDVLLDISGSFENMDPRKSFTLGEKLGIDKNTILFLQRGREEVSRLVKDQESFGGVTEQSAQRATMLTESISQLKVSFKKLREGIANESAPTIENVTGKLKDFIDLLARNPGKTTAAIGLIGTALAAWVSPIGAATLALGVLLEDIAKGSKGIKRLYEEIKSIGNEVLESRSFTKDAYGNPISPKEAFFQGTIYEDPLELAGGEESKRRLAFLKQTENYAKSAGSFNPLRQMDEYATMFGASPYGSTTDVKKDQTFNVSIGDITVQSSATNAGDFAKDLTTDIFLNHIRKTSAAFSSGVVG